MRFFVLMFILSGCVSKPSRPLYWPLEGARKPLCINVDYKISFSSSSEAVKSNEFWYENMRTAMLRYGLDIRCENPEYLVEVLVVNEKSNRPLVFDIIWASVSFATVGIVPYESKSEIVVFAKDLSSQQQSKVSASVARSFSIYNVFEARRLNAESLQRVGLGHEAEMRVSFVSEAIYGLLKEKYSLRP
ncbi:hypothetical protein ACES2I_08825 [Bdellovibrio bacteriovorus]|uniref:hypothetical protein n=1 Tax=Bdellovibrio bacteriovorus TaxID=959 RepID=UPI0035A5E341